MKRLTLMISTSPGRQNNIVANIPQFDKVQCIVREFEGNDDAFRNRLLPEVETDYVWFVNDRMDIANADLGNIVEQTEKEYDIILLFLRFRGRLKEWGADRWIAESGEVDLSDKESRVAFFNRIYGCHSPPQSRIYKTDFLRAHDHLRFDENCPFSDFRHNWLSVASAERLIAVAGYPIYDYIDRPGFKKLKWYEHACIVQAVRDVRNLIVETGNDYLLDVYRKRADAAMIFHLKEMTEYINEKGNAIWKDAL